MTPSEAVSTLRAALPDNPEHDGPVEAAARALLEALSRPPVLTAPLTDEEFAEAIERYKSATAAFPLIVLPADSEVRRTWRGRIVYNDDDGHLMFVTDAWPAPDDGQEVIVTPAASSALDAEVEAHRSELPPPPASDTRPHDLAGCRSRDGLRCSPDCGCRCHGPWAIEGEYRPHFGATVRHVDLGECEVLIACGSNERREPLARAYVRFGFADGEANETWVPLADLRPSAAPDTEGAAQ